MYASVCVLGMIIGVLLKLLLLQNKYFSGCFLIQPDYFVPQYSFYFPISVSIVYASVCFFGMIIGVLLTIAFTK